MAKFEHTVTNGYSIDTRIELYYCECGCDSSVDEIIGLAIDHASGQVLLTVDKAEEIGLALLMAAKNLRGLKNGDN